MARYDTVVSTKAMYQPGHVSTRPCIEQAMYRAGQVHDKARYRAGQVHDKARYMTRPGIEQARYRAGQV